MRLTARPLLTAATAICLLFSAVSRAQPAPTPAPTPDPPLPRVDMAPADMDRMVDEGKTKMLEILAVAIAHPVTPKMGAIYTRIRKHFLYEKVEWVYHKDPNLDFKACAAVANTNAYVIPSASKSLLYMCHAGWALAQFNPLAYAEIFIHEFAHLIGFLNECDAWRIQSNAMKDGGEGPQFITAYEKTCNKDKPLADPVPPPARPTP